MSNLCFLFECDLCRQPSFSIHLAIQSLVQGVFYWTKTCEPLAWNNWSPKEISDTKPDKYCVKMTVKTGQFRRLHCHYRCLRQYMCEIATG